MKILKEISDKILKLYMRHFIISIILTFCFQHCVFGQKPFIVAREDISVAEQERIRSLINERQWDSFLFWQHRFMNLHTCNLKEFVHRAIMVNGFIEYIEFKDSTIIISYNPDFYSWSNLETIFYHYHDLYQSFFSFDEVEMISVVLTDGYNVTFLPTIETDYWMQIEGAIMKRRWHIPGIDYIMLLGIDRVEAGYYTNENFEFIPDKIDARIREFRNTLEK